jgi:two-component sensor histidine kinase/PAS domain-containing protein
VIKCSELSLGVLSRAHPEFVFRRRQVEGAHIMTRIVVSDSTMSDSVMSDIQTFLGVEDASILALAIVDSVAEPLVVLDSDLRVVAASKSFYLAFKVDRQSAQGRLIYELDEGQWDIAELRMLLEKVLPEHGLVEGYEVEREFPSIGRRAVRMSARRVRHRGNLRSNILLTLTDVTEARAAERETQELTWQKEALLKEMRRRVGNSAAIMASILTLQAKTAQSEETRQHLQDAHKRVMSVAAAQDNLHVAGQIELIEIAPYLSRLCRALADSMIGVDGPISLQVQAAAGHMNSAQAVSIGLIVTELVLDARKPAFPAVTRAGQIVVGFESAGTDWKLSISDNGIGMAQEEAGPLGQERSSLGTSIVKTLAQQLQAEVEVVTGPTGTSISITHATAATRKDRPARAPKRASSVGLSGALHALSNGSSTGGNKFAA